MSDVDVYTDVLMQLLPRGDAWPRSTTSDLYKLVRSLAYRYARANTNANKLFPEMRPASTQQLLAEWESYLGLPDCSAIAAGVVQRRTAAVEKFYRQGGLWSERIEAFLAVFGITATVTEKYPHHCLRSCVYPLNRPEYRHITVVTVSTFDNGQATCMDNVKARLKSDLSLLVECLLTQYKMAGRGYEILYKD